jgi:HSP20 family protein
MALVKWHPWTELATFKPDFDRFFDLHGPEIFGPNGTRNTMWRPSIDLHETDTTFVLEADLPGMSIDDITLHVEGSTLMIGGERTGEQTNTAGNGTRVERTFGKFQRVFTLPAAVKVDSIKAKYINGVLTVTIPKAEEAKTRRIAIQAA